MLLLIPNSLAGLGTICMKSHWYAPIHYFITASAMPLVNPGYSFASFCFHSGIINCDDKRHLFVLHYIFRPWINRVLKSFFKSWNKHPIRTENNWSPEQIWTMGWLICETVNISIFHDFRDSWLRDWWLWWLNLVWYWLVCSITTWWWPINCNSGRCSTYNQGFP